MTRRIREDRPEPIRRAIEAAGGVGKLATKVAAVPGQTRLSGDAVSQWEEIPAVRVPAVSKVTGIPLWELRPDLYDAPAPADPR